MKKKTKAANTRPLHKAAGSMKPYSIVKDKESKPVFVLVPYDVWQESKRAKRASTTKRPSGSRRARKAKDNPWPSFAGILGVREDGLEYQHRMRNEWS